MSTPQPDALPEGLRQRNYRETQTRIQLAAIDLAERNGLCNVTTAQIAEAAGISRRTFFRYFSCKEQAIMPGPRRYLDTIDSIELAGSNLTVSDSILATIEAIGDQVLEIEGDPELTVHRRIAALLAAEPDLRTYGASQDVEIAERMADRFSAVYPDVSTADLALFSEIGITVWRHGWIRWSGQAEQPNPESPVESHRAVREAMRGAFQALAQQ
ncbi:TetR family transcriptional regulator [Leucobacter sp. cx-328]|uniref:TetR family transcriptional regulator n=1 Tax=unclassified Leucobacter TaxID=2621730 RepID=UPI00165E647F|nr:TetR family transcriptional regulator [Leucobacter sp. cx-328]